MIVGIMSWVNAFLPLLLWQVVKPRTTAAIYIFKTNYVYQWAWEFHWEAQFWIWGIPASLWALTFFLKGHWLTFLLLIWWSLIQFMLSPILLLIGVIGMMAGTGSWEDKFDAELQQWEIWTWSLAWLVYGLTSHYLYYGYWTEALLYYDEELQEAHEEEI